MKIEIFNSSEKFEETHDYRSFIVIKIDGKRVFKFLDGEPEDANISRDFSDVFKIKESIEAAYNAGKNGDVLTISETDCDDFIY